MVKKSSIKIQNQNGSLIIYTSPKGVVELRADTDKETIWATQDQIAEIFDSTKQNIGQHLKNIFETKELNQYSVVKNFFTTAKDGKQYKVNYYNLDAIIAIGYRVNSKKATQFRIWATKTLREYLIKGIAINSERIKQLPDKILNDLEEKISFIQRTVKKRELNQTESDSLLSVIHDYANSWKFLKQYDEGELRLLRSKSKERFRFEYDFIRLEIDKLKEDLMIKGEASELFASEKDETFKGILRTIYQTFGGKELYASLDEKAAHLLYFIIKDHPFSDGNKRVGSFLFIAFLKLNGILYRPNGEKKINDNTLVALALLIAESDPKDKELMVTLTTNLLG